MIEKLTIRDFAGINNLELTLEEINILIGPQASGKSISAKSLYFFKTFINELFKASEEELLKKEFEKLYLQKFGEYFPIQSLGQSDFYLRYDIEDKYIQILRDDGKLYLGYSDFFSRELSSLRKQFKDINNKGKKREDVNSYSYRFVIQKEFYEKIQSAIAPQTTFSQLFIPAGRSFFSILQSGIFSFLSSNKGLDPFLTEFGSLYESLKRYPPDYFGRNKKLNTLKDKINPIVDEILCGKYIREKGKDYLESTDGRRTSLENSSSGQQEILPIAIILSIIPFIGRIGNGFSIYIEEPEAHLFPSAQRKIVELIATIYNLTIIPEIYIVTTHSPYVLAALNNLLHAGKLSKELNSKQKAALHEIVPKEQWLNSDKVSVYSLKDGTATNIKSSETGLITTDILDSVSDELGSQFDNLLNIE